MGRQKLRAKVGGAKVKGAKVEGAKVGGVKVEGRLFHALTTLNEK